MKPIRLFCLVSISILIDVGCEQNESTPGRFRITPVKTEVVLGRTRLHSAPNWTVAKRLTAQGADVNAKSNSGQTPLFWAVAQRQKNMIGYLIVSSADINAKDKYGITSLHWAVAHADKDVAEVLISHGADINAKDNGGRTALWHAEQKGHAEIAEFLREH